MAKSCSKTPTDSFRLYEAYLQQSLFDGKASMLIGLHDLNSEFYVTDAVSVFDGQPGDPRHMRNTHIRLDAATESILNVRWSLKTRKTPKAWRIRPMSRKSPAIAAGSRWTPLLQSMDEINLSSQKAMEQVNESNARIAEIVKVISDIGNKTKVINDIVFQTKLLSFNASVEAARG